MEKMIHAFDPILKHRCVFVVRKGKAISLVTGFEFKYNLEV